MTHAKCTGVTIPRLMTARAATARMTEFALRYGDKMVYDKSWECVADVMKSFHGSEYCTGDRRVTGDLMVNLGEGWKQVECLECIECGDAFFMVDGKPVPHATCGPPLAPDALAETRITSSTGGQKNQKLARIGSIDPQAILRVAQVAGFGEQKYSRLNYLNGYDWSLSFDACMRHMLAFWSGEDLDPESGLPHLAHAAWHNMAMIAFMEKSIGTDDRFVQ